MRFFVQSKIFSTVNINSSNTHSHRQLSLIVILACY